jgi:hypothetical protein
MSIELKIFKQDNIDENIYSEVESTGNELLRYLSGSEVIEKVKMANMPGMSSSFVQNIFIDKAKDLGFQSEKKDLFAGIPTSHLRPDYYKRIGESGVIMEVERGKTIMNNMDMLDFWKCHVCKHANHLFLFVPQELKHNNGSKGYDCFKIVSNRMQPFFERTNYTNVHSIWIYGY